MDVYDSFINDEEDGTVKGEYNEEDFQLLTDSPEIDDIIDNIDEDRAANSYDSYIGAEVVMPDRKGDNRIKKVRKRIDYGDISTTEGHYNSMHNKYLYEVEKFTDVTTEHLTSNIIARNMISQVDSEGHHYQVLTEVTEHKGYDRDITMVNGFTKYSNGNLHCKRETSGLKLLVE